MLDDYLKELQHITLLQPDEERALWQAYKDEGNLEARSRLIEQYQPLVFKETMRWHIHRGRPAGRDAGPHRSRGTL